MKGRDDTGKEPQPLKLKATGLWFRRKGFKERMQRFDEAAPYNGKVHWYLGHSGWHAYTTDQVTPIKGDRK